MSEQHPPVAQPPYGQQPPPGYYPPPKKKHTARNILIAMGVLFVVFVGGCFAVVGLAANEVSDAIEESENETGGRANPVEITPGEAFSVRGFDYAAGWTVGADALGDIQVEKLKVTNNRDDRDSALVEIKFWKGQEILGMTSCTTELIEVGTTVALSCLSGDDMPKRYNRVTINDTF
ncbi:MAG TPA: hypothetical protein VMF51_08345 [Nocardioides sp.]|uniref:hypothetical protein n=1 Tax=Nocardioides sp. TaxID=35761 RepID=UPI002BAB4B0F|nr:hypothetical protein [Nocardioides sp.]HTW15125.1 hypothetical protein [Nocardioides sp.]